MRWSEPILVLGLTALASFFCLFHLGKPSIGFKHDERTHVTVVQEMLHSGNYFEPRLNDRLYFNKPPLKMWLSLLPLSVFGESNFTYRILDGLAGVLTVLLTYAFARFVSGSRFIGVLAALFLLSNKTFLFERIVRHAVQDSFLVLLSLVAGWLLIRGWEGNRRPLYFVAGLLAGAAVLCKSVAGFTIVILWSLFVAVHSPRLLFGAPNLLPWAGALVLPALWFVPHFIVHGAALMKNVNHEVVGRVTEGYHQVGRPFFYLEYMLYRRAFSPWLPLVVGMLSVALATAGSQVRARERWLLIWALGAIVGYSILPSRSLHYLAPAFPAFAVLSALGIRALGRILIARGALLRLAALTALVFSTYQLARDLRGTTIRTLGVSEPIGIDALLQLVRKEELTVSVHPDVRFTQREALYAKMLQPFIAERSDIFITTLADIGAAGGTYSHFFELRPVHERPESLVALAARALPGFEPIARTIDSALNGERAEFGWGKTLQIGDVGVRLIERPSAVLTFHTTSLRSLITRELQLNAMLPATASDANGAVQIHLNGIALGEQSFRRGALVTRSYPIPGHAFVNGKNTVVISTRHPPLYVNWLHLAPDSQGNGSPQNQAP